MQYPALEVFKTQVDKALSNLVSGWPCFELEVGLETSHGTFQPNDSVFVT